MRSKITVKFMPQALEFIETLGGKTRTKVYYDIDKTENGFKGDWFKKMSGTDGLFEFRTLYNEQYIRLFAFWDRTGKEETLIVCTHGIIKKTDKTPQKEIDLAERLKKEYFEDKGK
jgi:phage-related protein